VPICKAQEAQKVNAHKIVFVAVDIAESAKCQLASIAVAKVLDNLPHIVEVQSITQPVMVALVIVTAPAGVTLNGAVALSTYFLPA